MANRVGYLTIFSADRKEIFGEFCDADWRTEGTTGESNNVFSGIAGDGASETFKRINDEGISNVTYCFESQGYKYAGAAQLLAPASGPLPGSSIIRIESGDPPTRVL